MAGTESKQTGSGAAEAARDATFGTLPVLTGERMWGFFDLGWVMIGMAIATWAFLIGGDMVYFVGFKAGIAASVLGNALGVGLVAISVLGNTKYGTEHYTLMRIAFGRHGVKPLIYIANFIVGVGWTAILAIMFGRSSVNVINALFDTTYGGDSGVVVAFAVISLVLVWLIVVRGPIALKWFNRIAAPGLALIVVAMLVVLLRQNSYSEFVAIPPLEPFGNPLLDFMIVVEFNLGAALSWWPGNGNLTRLARTQRGSFWAQLIGLGVVGVVAQTVGMMAALAIGDSDPTVWMIPLTGAAFGVVILIWIAFANVTSMSTLSYIVLVAMRQEGVKFLYNMRWSLMVAIYLGLAALLCIRPSALYDNFFQFLLWLALGYAPALGVMVVDYYVLRRQRVDLPALYQTAHGTPYDFWRGWNIGAWIAVLAGTGSYLLLLNPSTLWSSAPFSYVTATLPAAAVAALVHFVLARVWVRPSGRGGYAG